MYYDVIQLFRRGAGAVLIFTLESVSSEQETKFLAIYHTYRKLMFHTANRILNNPHDAEDAVQQALLSILKIIEKISEAKCPQTRGLVVTIVERKAIDIYRAKQRRNILPLEEEYINIPASSEIETAEQRTDLSRAINMLPARYRELIQLKYDYGFSDQEIAAMLDMTVANVKRTIQRAKKKLEMILEGQEG